MELQEKSQLPLTMETLQQWADEVRRVKRLYNATLTTRNALIKQYITENNPNCSELGDLLQIERSGIWKIANGCAAH